MAAKQLMNDAEFMAWMRSETTNSVEVVNVTEGNYDSAGELVTDSLADAELNSLWQNRHLLLTAHGPAEQFPILVQVYDYAPTTTGKVHQISPWMTPAEVPEWIKGGR